MKCKTLVLTARHDWGVDGTKARVTARFEALQASFKPLIGAADLAWRGNVGDVRVRAFGQTVTATCDVQPASLTIAIELPWLLAGLAGPLEAFLDSHADLLRSTPKAGAGRPVMEPLPMHRRLLSVSRRVGGALRERNRAR